MRHLRTDYEAIQPFPTKRPHVVKIDGETVDAQDGLQHIGKHMDPIIPDDEPVFLLRAKDPVAHDVVRLWADYAQMSGADLALCDRVRAWAQEMDDYRVEHYPDKVMPDTPAELLRP